jgi:hypothetical protein
MNKYLKFLILLFLTSCISKTTQIPNPLSSIPKTSYQQIIAKKYTHPLIVKSFENAALFRESQKNDLEKLQQKISETKVTIDDHLIEKIRNNLEKELQYLQDFSSLAGNLTFYDFDESVIDPTLETNYIFPQVKYNKMNLFVSHTLKFSNKELKEIVNGKIISKIYQKNYQLPAADNGKEIRSNLTIPSVIIAMLETLKTIDEKIYAEYLQNNLHKNSLFYWFKAPKELNINQNSIFNAENKGLKGLAIIHNGYAFGGSVSVDEIRKSGFHTMPHDCSSYVSYLLGLGIDPEKQRSNVLWTSDAQNLVNLILDQNYFSLKGLKNNLPAYGIFAGKMSIIQPKEISDFKEGDLLMFRKFSDGIFSKAKKSNSLGKGGHIGVVLGTDNEDEIYILSYIRNYEKFQTGGLLISQISFQKLQNEIYSSYLFR